MTLLKRISDYKVLFLLLNILLFYGCKHKEETITHTHGSWKSHEPLSIPIKTRMQYFTRGNLILNPSFEKGKFFSIDSTHSTFSIDGWKPIGNHVSWISIVNDTANLTDINRVSDHAIKISRGYANEDEKNDNGILSDFIKVIPGNYEFSLDIKIEKLTPVNECQGTRLYDAFDLRLIYYDKNKIEIGSNKYSPLNNTYYNASIKGTALSNLWYIDSLDWSRIQGKSNNIALFERDIPDEAWYIKVFIGIKGIGSLWIDNVNLSYTENNFSLLERTQQYFDTIASPVDLILPTPKVIQEQRPIRYFDKNGELRLPPVILIPYNAQLETIEAAEELLVALKSIFSNNSNLKIVKENEFSGLTGEQFVFNVGKTGIFEAFKNMLPYDTIANKKQGYFIKAFSNRPKLLFLVGSDPIGDYYAVTTLKQLMDAKSYTIHYAGIIDFPDFKERGIYVPNIPTNNFDFKNYYDYLGLAKYNSYTYSPQFTKNQLNKNSFDKTNVIYDISLSLSDSTELQSIDKITSDIINTFKKNSAESSNLIIDFSYLSDRIKNLSYNRKTDTILTVAKIHTDIINKVSQQISERNRIIVLLPWNNSDEFNSSSGNAELYYHILLPSINKDIKVIWNGNNKHQLSVDIPDLLQIEGISNKKPILCYGIGNYSQIEDLVKNYCSYYSGKTRILNLFLPFEPEVAPDFFEDENFNQILYYNQSSSEISKISNMVFADFMWNSQQFDAAYSIWKALTKNYSEQAAEHIIKFNNAYFGLLTVALDFENGNGSNKLTKHGDIWKKNLEFHIENLERLKLDPHMLSELKAIKNQLVWKYDNSVESLETTRDTIN
ncbi:MAG: hypothetical protein JXB49_14840 [Bacteroidales bacterium]|nr:hypothetical protein [Bacteroidales bacterium]